MKVIIIGPAYPLRGGLASFDERLARAFQSENNDVTIYTFSLQYPKILFPGTTQFSEDPAPTDLKIKVCINSINPINWLSVGKKIAKENADIILIRYWMPFMAPAFGTILRRVKKNRKTKIVCLADNVIPHEKFPMQTQLTKYFFKPVDGFVTMSESVMQDLRKFTTKPAHLVAHPLYDNFGEPLEKVIARDYLKIDPQAKIILFFGFIRQYKGLDLLLEAMHLLQEKGSDIQLLVAGEFYEDSSVYDTIIQNYSLKNIILRTHFIADSEVKYYLSAADFVIQPYRNATQSGVTPLAYHFGKPMLVTNVGGLPDLVPNDKVGVVVEPKPQEIANGIIKLYDNGEDHYLPHLIENRKNYSWNVLVEKITKVVNL
ncbi:MAG: glycosyl transferase family 1 [Pseudopedobacter saltans]|uniref:Glycosyl transferase family 1 n=1 Tax=Pseudopedobacter saltans TaxID=151895 RepID=A0A2W5H7B7_9SPHI|nr:MAG: glycosyl transferase family 1 [Pseudopedobacter saltans]